MGGRFCTKRVQTSREGQNVKTLPQTGRWKGTEKCRIRETDRSQGLFTDSNALAKRTEPKYQAKQKLQDAPQAGKAEKAEPNTHDQEE